MLYSMQKYISQHISWYHLLHIRISIINIYIYTIFFVILHVLCCILESSVLLRFGSSLGGGWSTKVLPGGNVTGALWETSSNLNVAKAGKDEQIQSNELNTFWTFWIWILGWFESKRNRRMTIHLKHTSGQSSTHLFQLMFHLIPFSNFHMYLTPATLAVLWTQIFHLFVFESFQAFYGVLPVFSRFLVFYVFSHKCSTRPPLARGWRWVFPRLQAEKNMKETSVVCGLYNKCFKSVLHKNQKTDAHTHV